MKKLLTTAALAICMTSVHAQFDPSFSGQETNIEKKKVYWSLIIGSGIHNYSGILGIGGEAAFAEKLAVRTGVGIGGWGTKFSIDARYQKRFESGMGFGIGYSWYSGMDDIELDVDDGSRSRKVTFDLLPVQTLNLSGRYNWVFENDNQFYLEYGFAISTGPEKYFETPNGEVLNSNEEAIMEAVRPGETGIGLMGIILSIGYAFSLN